MRTGNIFGRSSHARSGSVSWRACKSPIPVSTQFCVADPYEDGGVTPCFSPPPVADSTWPPICTVRWYGPSCLLRRRWRGDASAEQGELHQMMSPSICAFVPEPRWPCLLQLFINERTYFLVITLNTQIISKSKVRIDSYYFFIHLTAEFPCNYTIIYAIISQAIFIPNFKETVDYVGWGCVLLSCMRRQFGLSTGPSACVNGPLSFSPSFIVIHFHSYCYWFNN